MIEIFPIDPSGNPRFTNDWGYPRSGGRTHQGNDLFATEGTEVIAVTSGNVRFGQDPFGGNIARLLEPDGTYYYFAHLKGFAGSNRFVTAGETIGYVGTTGNAKGTPPHLHFEWHPQGGAAVNPYSALRAAPMRGRANPPTPISLPEESTQTNAALVVGGLMVLGAAVFAFSKRHKQY